MAPRPEPRSFRLARRLIYAAAVGPIAGLAAIAAVPGLAWIAPWLVVAQLAGFVAALMVWRH